MRVDVMMPAFNAVGTVEVAVTSLLGQTHADLRIIAVDDGSTDGTGAILNALASRDARVTVAHQENHGIVGARNAALALATSDYVTQLDADDISEPDHVARLAAHLAAHPDCVMVSGAARHIGADGRALGPVVRFGPPGRADAAWVPSREPLCLPFAMWRRSALDAARGYRETGLGSDVDLAWRLMALGDVTNLPDVVGSYRLHDSATGTSLANGRFLAVCTQLIAVSARRRALGADDLAFTRATTARVRAADSLAGMCVAARAGLSEAEAAFLEIAVAAKMLQWLEGRGRLPEAEDVAFIRRAFGGTAGLSAENRGELKRLYSVLAARLMRAGMWRKAAALTPPPIAGVALARTMLGRC